MKTKISFFITLFALITVNGYSQFSLDAEIRPKFEYRNGYKTLPDINSSYAALVSQRTRIIANYKAEKLQVKLSLQDVRLWGDEKFKTDIATTALYEAWAELKVLDSLQVKIGKQEFLYDNQRLLDIGNWGNVGITHNALLLKYKCNTWTIHLAAAYNQVLDTNFTTNYSKMDVKDNYKTLNFLWISKQLKDFNISALAIADGFQKPKTTNTVYLRYTAGPIVTYKGKKFDMEARGFYQGGKSQTGKDISSWLVNAEASYKIFKPLTLKVGAEVWSGYDYTDSTSKQVNSFDVLYGSSHKFNGALDYFTKPSESKNAGLVDVFAHLIYKTAKKTTYKLEYHYFALQNNYGKKNGAALDKYLGSEIDLNAKYVISKDVTLEGGFSWMLATSTMDKIKGGSYAYYPYLKLGSSYINAPNWAYVMLIVKPTLFASK